MMTDDERAELEHKLRILRREKMLWGIVIVGQCLIIALGFWMVGQGI